ncbi:MAG: LytTR family DNA-binding domain-containing protein [Myxococcota bacterium]
MNGLTGLIVDDELPARRFLAELLEGTGAFRDTLSTGDPEEAARLVKERRVDVAFVDIRLVDAPGDTSGLDLAKTLSAATKIVLATASPSHAVQGFELGVVDYLLKPFRGERVQRCVDRIRSQPREEGPARLVARDGNALRFLDIAGAYAFEARERLTFVHHREGTFVVDPSLAKLSAALGPDFLRVHRNWLVAPAHVEALLRQEGAAILQLAGGTEVPVSRERTREVRQALLRETVGLAGSSS